MPCIGYFKEKSTDALALNETTSCQSQLNLYQNLRQTYPSIISGCPTNHWLAESINAQRKFEPRYEFVKTNTLIICAQHDLFVYNRAMIMFGQRAPACKMLYARDAYHEILFEKEAIRGAAIKVRSNICYMYVNV
jgi:lysophospholipase